MSRTAGPPTSRLRSAATWVVAFALALQGVAAAPLAAPGSDALAHDLATSICRAASAEAEPDSGADPPGPRHAKPFCCVVGCAGAHSSKPLVLHSVPPLAPPPQRGERLRLAHCSRVPAAARIFKAQPRAPPLS